MLDTHETVFVEAILTLLQHGKPESDAELPNRSDLRW